jgi:hypothetical protein
LSEPSRFAHASEAELARILDYYAVRWEYEPRTFPILWNPDGTVVESFSPDFYLPELDTYVELTTLKQSLVRRKNRKLRRVRELYPDIRIKLFYGKDFKALLLKYGRFDLAASLSGLEGQAAASPPVEQPAGAPTPSPTQAAPAAAPEPATVASADSAGADAASRRVSRGSRRRRARRARAAASASLAS